MLWAFALLCFCCEVSPDVQSWGVELPLHLWPKSPIHTVGSNEANIYFKFRSISRVCWHPDRSFSGFFSPLAFSQSVHDVCVQASALPSLLCVVECLSTHPDPITANAPKIHRPVFPSLTANSQHTPLFIAAQRVSWELVELGEGSECLQMRTDQLNKLLSFVICSISTVPWLAGSEENRHIPESIWTFLLDTLLCFVCFDLQRLEEFSKAAALGLTESYL